MSYRRANAVTLCLLLFLAVLQPASAELRQAAEQIAISARELSWALTFPGRGFKLGLQRHRQDGRGHYYMFTHATTGLNASFYVEPAESCTTAEACREAYWRNRHPSMASAQGVTRFERNGFAFLEFTVRFQVPEGAGRTAEQHHFSGHLVRDGFWVDMHLSMMPYVASQPRTFLDFVDAIRIEPKTK